MPIAPSWTQSTRTRNTPRPTPSRRQHVRSPKPSGPLPVLCLTESIATARRLAIAWGVHGVITKDVQNFGDMVDKACRIALAEELAVKGERLVITAGVPFGTPGATNILRIAWVNG